MSNTEIIKIPKDISLEVEKKFFEWQASLHIIGYLMSRPDTQMSLLQQYLDTSEVKFTETELIKAEVTNSYPSQKGYEHYTFDFINSQIIYKAEA